MSATDVHLVDLVPEHSRVGFGRLGLRGDLGYEGKRVCVGGEHYARAISAHPPSRVRFVVGGKHARLRCRVALNDDVPPGRSHADFSVYGDGRLLAAAYHVVAAAPPRALVADLRGVDVVELDVSTSVWAFCHAVWIDPVLDGGAAPADPAATDGGFPLLDCLARAEISKAVAAPRAARCIATVVSPGFTELLDDMLGSLRANGNCDDATLVVFGLDADAACHRVAAKYGATLVPCRSHARVNATSKALLYSVARVVDAERYLCLDADTLVLGDLGPLFGAIDAAPAGSLLACREGNGPGLDSLGRAFRQIYFGTHEDAQQLGLTDEDLAYPLVPNDGVFAGGRDALLALDGFLRLQTNAVAWVDERHDVWWRNQFMFNLALARLRCGVEIDGAWNLQLHVQNVTWREAGGRAQALWRERPVGILHFSGSGRRKYREQKDLYARVADPLPAGGGGDLYADFLTGLRAWIGRHGMRALTWSFYRLGDGRNAGVADPSVFPLLALLHHLLRANGCVRVLEAGTAAGVSAACMASAVAHRPDGRVVTFDPTEHGARDALWALMPAPVRACIEARRLGSLAGMAAALEAGERYEAALLDAIHSTEHAEHVDEQLALATQLVCPGGLILVHDLTRADGGVGAAIDRIQAAGYGVARLWTAERGEREDDRLGLAVIENRRLGQRPVR